MIPIKFEEADYMYLCGGALGHFSFIHTNGCKATYLFQRGGCIIAPGRFGWN